MFSREFCEISKNTFFHRTPLVAASSDNNVYSTIDSLKDITNKITGFHNITLRKAKCCMYIIKSILIKIWLKINLSAAAQFNDRKINRRDF